MYPRYSNERDSCEGSDDAKSLDVAGDCGAVVCVDLFVACRNEHVTNDKAARSSACRKGR